MHLLVYLEGDDRLEALLRAGTSVDVRNDDGFTLLHTAVSLGHEKVVQTLLAYGADVHAKDPNYLRTPLHNLILYNDKSPSCVPIFRALVDHGADLELTAGDSGGVTCFHLAARYGNANLLKELLQAYDACGARSHGSSLDIASCSTLVAPSVPAPTVSAVSLQCKKGKTPLHSAAESGDLETVCLLLQAGATKDVHDFNGGTPFFLATTCGNTSILDMLQFPDCVNMVFGETNMTPLHFAAWSGHIDAARWLLQHGALVELMDTGGFSPLHYASMNGCSEIIECLILEGNANPQQRRGNDPRGTWALGLADEMELYDVARSFVRVIKLNGEQRIKVWVTDGNNGAQLLHYFAAYGTEEELRWILNLIQSKTALHIVCREFEGDPLNNKDYEGRTTVHWAAMRNNKDVVGFLAKNKADLNAESDAARYRTPLSLALINGDMEFAEELLRCKPKAARADDWIRGIRMWMYDYYSDPDKNLGEMLSSLKEGFAKHTSWAISHSILGLFEEIPPIYLALHCKRDDIAKFIQRHSRGVKDAVNEKGERTGRTALHWATLLRQREIVAQLCRVEVFARELTANVEDVYGKTALQYSKEMKLEDIEKELMLRSDVKSSIDSMCKDRQVHVDSANAILVGAALIAGVTFAGWLQPPLSYMPYYNLPQLPPPSPPDIFQSYAAVQQHMGVRLFWVFNSLSFSFAIATMVAGLVAVVPVPGIYIATSVAHLRRCLLIACSLIGLSIVFVLGAFAAAGFAVLPPVFEYQANMMATVIIGGIPCLVLLACFAHRLWSHRPEWMRGIRAKFLFNVHQIMGTSPGQSSSPKPESEKTTAGSTEVDVPRQTSETTGTTLGNPLQRITNSFRNLDVK